MFAVISTCGLFIIQSNVHVLVMIGPIYVICDWPIQCDAMSIDHFGMVPVQNDLTESLFLIVSQRGCLRVLTSWGGL